MKKYGLSEKGLRRLFHKLVAAKILTQAEIDIRASTVEEVYAVSVDDDEANLAVSSQTRTQTIFKCPSCGETRNEEFSECPSCGIIVSKFHPKRKKVDPEDRSKQSQTPVNKVIRGPATRLQPPKRRGLGGLLLLIGSGTGVVILIIVITAYFNITSHQVSKKQQAITQSQSIQTDKPPIQSPEITIGVCTLWYEYRDNEVAADEKYRGRILNLTDGDVLRVGKDMRGRIYLRLQGADPRCKYQCFFPNESAGDLAKLSPGQRNVAVQGECAGWLNGTILLRDCDLVR